VAAWYRRLGPYPIQVVEIGAMRDLFEKTDLAVTGHEPRYIYGTRMDMDRNTA
jgi:radical SAM superfamily enzyme with C-terminal helix-hairpin-helix motif